MNSQTFDKDGIPTTLPTLERQNAAEYTQDHFISFDDIVFDTLPLDEQEEEYNEESSTLSVSDDSMDLIQIPSYDEFIKQSELELREQQEKNAAVMYTCTNCDKEVALYFCQCCNMCLDCSNQQRLTLNEIFNDDDINACIIQ